MSNPNRHVTVTGYPAAYLYPNRVNPANPANPPPAVAAPPPYNNDRCCPQSNNRCRRICSHVFAVIVISVIIFYGCGNFFLGISWDVHQPKAPQFRVESFSISNFTLGNDLLDNFTSEVRLSVRNPNKKMSLVYSPIKASILYGSEFLSNTTVPRFSQEKKNETFLAANFADELIFLGRQVVVGINHDRVMNNGNVSFNLLMESEFRYVAGVWGKVYRNFMVICNDLVVSIPTNGTSGTLTSGPRQCRVDYTD